MKKLFILLSIAVVFSSCDPKTFQAALESVLEEGGGVAALSKEEVGAGLKEALDIGITKGAQKLSQQDGYFKSPYKILLPPEAQKVADRLQNVPGFKRLEATILEKINRGAEDAAKKATPIFKEAITKMTFRDAFDILMGADNAATNYLEKSTYQNLYSEFNPVIIQSLDKFKARKIWSDAVNAYNKIPLNQDKADPDLDDYVTKRALDGLFQMVAKKELDIRRNVAARTSDLLKKVFAKQDNK